MGKMENCRVSILPKHRLTRPTAQKKVPPAQPLLQAL